MSNRKILWLIPGLLLSLGSLAEMYKWTDNKGKIHYSDKKPSEDDINNQPVDIIDSEKMPGNFLPTTVVDLGFAIEEQQNEITLEVIFETVGYELSSSRENKLRALIRNIHDTYKRLFGWQASSQQAVNIRIWGDANAFREYELKVRGKTSKSFGFYLRRDNLAAVLAREFVDETDKTILHEASHAILRTEARWIPKWLNEGLAEYFESADLRNQRFINRIPDDKKGLLAEIMKDKKTAYLERFFELNASEWKDVHSREESRYYVTAWSVVSFLMETPSRREFLAAMLASSKNRKNAFNETSYINQYYQGGMQAFSRDWKAWSNRVSSS